jgi:hypothetical protein
MNRDEFDALVARINSLIDEGRPTESDDSVGLGTGTYVVPQQFSLNKLQGDTP